MKNLTSFYKPSMHNDTHQAFHKMAYDILSQNAEALGLNAAAMTRYSQSLEHEQTFINRTLGSQYTDMLRDADKVRDNAFRYLITRLSAALYGSSDDDLQYAPAIKKYILDKYPLTIASIGDKEETSQIAGLLVDLELEEVKGYVTAMKLGDAVSALSSANEQYQALYILRNEERSKYITEDMAKTRVVNDEYFDLFASRVLVLANDFDTSAETFEPANAVLDQINELLADFRARVKRYGGNPDAPEPAATSLNEESF